MSGPSNDERLAAQRAPAADGLVALLNDWSHDGATLLFADNVVLDEPFSRQRATAGRLLEQHGQLRIVEIRPEAAASGNVVVQGNGPTFTIGIELSPVAGGAIQLYEIDDPTP